MDVAIPRFSSKVVACTAKSGNWKRNPAPIAAMTRSRKDFPRLSWLHEGIETISYSEKDPRKPGHFLESKCLPDPYSAKDCGEGNWSAICVGLVHGLNKQESTRSLPAREYFH